MSRFNTAGARPTGRSAVATAERATTRTHAGGPGFARDEHSELFLSAVTSLTDANFYESESARLMRQRELVARVAITDPAWALRFLRWLRTDARIRTAALILAAEAVKARLDAQVDDTVTSTERGFNRQMIDVVCQRADEPGEMLAYWTSRYGRALPMPVKRGVADAVGRLYTEKSLLKYDGQSKGYRFGDVIELTHPKPAKGFQGALFTYALDRRHNRENYSLEGLNTIQADERLRAQSAEAITALAESGELAGELARAGMTWEAVPNLVGGPWTAKLWEAIIPSMGVMALARNLRNFDAAGVGAGAAAQVCAKLSSAEDVAASRILPMRLLSAYQNAPNVRWVAALEAALQHSLANIPALDGNTLILVDRSDSMFWHTSAKSQLTYADTAAVFGTALALRAQKATLVEYGNSSHRIAVPKGGSVLPMLSAFRNLGGTYTERAIREHLRGHDRVVLLTDEQSHDDPTRALPDGLPTHVFNLVGYRAGGIGGGAHRYHYAGLSDASWPLIELMERGSANLWPWS